MATISIDVESNKADLDTLVESANAKIGELQAILSQISAFQLQFTVTEVPQAQAELPAPAADENPGEQTEGAIV